MEEISSLRIQAISDDRRFANDLPIRSGPQDDEAVLLFATGFNAFNQLILQPSAKTKEEWEEQSRNRGKPCEDLFEFRQVLKGHEMSRPESYNTYSKVLVGGTDCCLAGRERDMIQNLELGDSSCTTATLANGTMLVYDPIDPASVIKYPSMRDWRDLQNGTQWRITEWIEGMHAFDTAFMIHFKDGVVKTVGDPRFEECLGRDVGPSTPAEELHPITDLQNLDGPVIRASAGAYCGAAVTAGGSLYTWGCLSPSSPGPFKNVTRVPNHMEVDGDKDVVDVAVGATHALALTSDGTIYAIGGNANGQLGIGKDTTKVFESWTKIDFEPPAGYKVTRVDAGARCSFITVEKI